MSIHVLTVSSLQCTIYKPPPPPPPLLPVFGSLLPLPLTSPKGFPWFRWLCGTQLYVAFHVDGFQPNSKCGFPSVPHYLLTFMMERLGLSGSVIQAVGVIYLPCFCAYPYGQRHLHLSHPPEARSEAGLSPQPHPLQYHPGRPPKIPLKQ